MTRRPSDPILPGARTRPWMVVHVGHVALGFALYGFYVSPLYRGLIYQPWKMAYGWLLGLVAVFGWVPVRRALSRGASLMRFPYFLMVALLVRRLVPGRRHGSWRSYWALRLVRMRWRLILLKSYFLPLMFGSLCDGVFNLFGQWSLGVSLYGTLAIVTTLLFLADSAVATAGYSLEDRRWGNPILAVEGSVVAWIFCLACYPPANLLTGRLLPLRETTHRLFQPGSPWQTSCDILVCLFLLVYVSGIVCQGLRFANLTYRGTTSHGLYALVRHPQYAAKLASWFFVWLPSLGSPLNVLSFLGWAGIYVGRALTEERFLSRFEDYQQYRARVRWRMIPGVW